MDLLSFFFFFMYFDKNIQPKCDYCQFGKRAKDGNKVLCEKRGLVDASYSCGKFVYSPLKRIPVKQLNFVGSLADEDIYIESAGDRAEKEQSKEKEAPKKAEKPAEKKPVEAKPEETKAEPVEEPKEEPAKDAPAEEKAPESSEEN